MSVNKHTEESLQELVSLMNDNRDVEQFEGFFELCTSDEFSLEELEGAKRLLRFMNEIK